MKYNLIYADCPWSFSNKNTGGSMKSGADAQYPTMTLEQMKNLDVQSATADDCILVMWWVGSQPKEAIELCEAWGFTIKNMNGFVWNKLTKNGLPFFGMGFYTRAGSESAIIAVKGKASSLIKSRSVRAVFNDPDAPYELIGSLPVGKHSAKPPEFRDKCTELVGDVPRLEMFARTETDGWSVFGNEVDGSITIGSE